MELTFPPGLDTKRFLEDYWQRRPLLIRQAFPGYHFPLSPEELAGLACDEAIESRLVLEKDGGHPWEALHGPFDEARFASLPASHWTLLLQDLDKFVPALEPLREAFRFLPEWRFDDIMVSYAVDRGSVGPHVDDYDVFLLQGAGRRRWAIHTHPVSDDDYIPGLDLRILPRFEAEQEWLLEPGDLLYLPPNVAHWGIAEGDDCITCSVGFRAPDQQELVSAWCEHLIEHRVPSGRLRDPGLALQSHPAEITPAALTRVDALLRRLLADDPMDHAAWFGRLVTEPKPQLEALPPEHPLTTTGLLQRWRTAGTLWRNPGSRFAFVRGTVDDAPHRLYVGGEELLLPPRLERLLALIAGQRQFDYTALEQDLTEDDTADLFCRLYNLGHLLLDHDHD